MEAILRASARCRSSATELMNALTLASVNPVLFLFSAISFPSMHAYYRVAALCRDSQPRVHSSALDVDIGANRRPGLWPRGRGKNYSFQYDRSPLQCRICFEKMQINWPFRLQTLFLIAGNIMMARGVGDSATGRAKSRNEPVFNSGVRAILKPV